MKKLFVILLLLAGAYVGGTYLAEGRLPWVAASAEGRKLDDLTAELSRARQQFSQAGRAQGLSGLDTSSMGSGLLTTLERIERDLDELTPALKSAEARSKARKLKEEITAFKNQIK